MQQYVEYAAVSPASTILPATSESEGASKVPWRTKARKARLARIAKDKEEKDSAGPSGDSEMESESSVATANMRADLSALSKASQLIAKSKGGTRSAAAIASLDAEVNTLRRNITASKPMSDQVHTLEGIWERKNAQLVTAHAAYMDAKSKASTLQSELAGIAEQLQVAQQYLATQLLEESRIAAIKAAEEARITVEKSANAQYIVPSLPCTPSPVQETPVLTANHIIFIQQMASKFLNPDQSAGLGQVFSALSPFLTAAGVTPYNMPQQGAYVPATPVNAQGHRVSEN